MADWQKTNFERSEFHLIRPSGHHGHSIRCNSVLFQLPSCDIGGKSPRIDRRAQMFERMSNSANMIFMGMGDKHPVNPIFAGFQPSNIGNNQIYSGRAIHIWKCDPQINDDQSFFVTWPVAIDITVHSHLTGAAEREIH